MSEQVYTEGHSPSRAMSALTSIASLVTSLLPNAMDLPQINHLICNLIQLPAIDGNGSAADMSGESVAEPIDGRRERHRKNERIRHNKIIELIQQLSESIGLNDRHETQASILSRSARYVLFLTHVIDKLEKDSTDDGIDILTDEWLQSLYPLYQRAYEEAQELLERASGLETTGGQAGGPQMPNHSLTQTRDHCLPLVKLEIEK